MFFVIYCLYVLSGVLKGKRAISKENKYIKKVNPYINKFAKTVFTEVSKKGINPVIKKKNLKKIYNETVLKRKEESLQV